jgi:cysteine desulfuration protein SufE
MALSIPLNMKPIDEIKKEIISEFEEFSDWQEKYQYLIELGEDLEEFPEDGKLKENLVPGCQSRVWLLKELNQETVKFKADSDSSITKGMIALLVRVFSGQTKDIIKNTDLEFLKQIGLDKHLSISRRNGLYSMVEKIRNF